MTLQLSTGVRNAILDSIETAAGASAILKIRTGAVPATCATADAGTVLATVSLPADWMAAAAGGVKAKSGTWEDASADASGTAAHFRIYAADGTTCHIQGTVSFTSMPWAPSTAYALGQKVSNGGNVYTNTQAGTSSASGGPQGTSAAITDGTAKWDYVSAVGDMTLDNTNLAAGQGFAVNGFTLTAPGA